MADGPPKLVALDHDNYSARYVGKTKDGNQFFLTTPFVPGYRGEEGAEFLALYQFDPAGKLLNATIEDLGPRKDLNEDACRARRDALLASLGEVKYQRITVAPFKVEQFGVEFGVIPEGPEDEEDIWRVIVEPGNYMCFFEPWMSGEYDT